MYRIKKNDMVKIIAGNYKGKTGKVLAIYPDKDKAIVDSINLIKRHTKPTQDNPKGGIIEKEAPIHLSNLALLHNNEPTKVGYKTLKDGKKVRYAKSTGETLDSL